MTAALDSPEPGAPRVTWGLVIDVFDALERHGFRCCDDEHTGRAIGLLGDLALIYAGEREHPAGSGGGR